MNRVIYICNARLPTEKANGYQIMQMCDAFSANGVETALYYPQRYQENSLLQVSPFVYYDIEETFLLNELQGIDALRWVRRDISILKKLAFRVQNLTHSINVVRKTRAYWTDPKTVIFSRDLGTMLALLLFRSSIRCKLVFEAHLFPGRSANKIVRRLAARLDLLVALTGQLALKYQERGYPAKRIQVEPDAVDIDRYAINKSQVECRNQLGLPLNRPIIGYIGRFHSLDLEKGIPDLIQAMHFLVNSGIEGELPLLLCVGGPMDRVPAYIKTANELGLSPELYRFHDRVRNSDVPLWIKACDVCTIPSPRKPFFEFYSSPMKLFEYMASGVPIVATNLAALNEVLTDGENALLCEPENPKSLATALYQVLYNRTVAQTISQQAQRDVWNYTWYRRAGRILLASSEVSYA